MKNLIKNLWAAPASTIVAALVAGIGVITASDLEVSKSVIASLSAVAAVLAAFSGPNKI